MADLVLDSDNKKILAIHSVADAIHDAKTRAILGAEGDKGIDILKLFEDHEEPRGTYNEDNIQNYIFDQVKDRRDLEETILVRTKTELTPIEDIIFQLAKTCDTTDKTLVYQDAGPTVYDLICNGTNAINPGSICDPARRPDDNAEQSSNPSAEFRIPGSVFGFKNDKVPTILLKNFTGRSVVCGVQYGDKWYDMAAGKKVNSENEVKTRKFINDPAGFFEGNGKNKTITVRDENYQLYYIGKLLGDGLQVITMLKSIDGKPNPYYQIKTGFGTQLINTHDRLQYARAVYLGVGALLTYGDNGKKASYIPGLEKPITIGDYKSRIVDVFETVRRRYRETIDSMEKSIKGGKFNPKFSAYASNKQYIINPDPAQNAQLVTFMTSCINKIRELEKQIVPLFEQDLNKSKKMTDINEVRRLFSIMNSRVQAESPDGSILRPTGIFKKVFKFPTTEKKCNVVDFDLAFREIGENRTIKAYEGRNKWLNPSALGKRPREETGGKRKGRKRTFRKKKRAFKGGDEETATAPKGPAPTSKTEGTKAVDAFTSKIYLYECRLIGFEREDPLAVGRELIVEIIEDVDITADKNFFLSEQKTVAEYKVPDTVKSNETLENDKKEQLVDALRKDENNLLAEFIHFITPNRPANMFEPIVIDGDQTKLETEKERVSASFLLAKLLINEATEEQATDAIVFKTLKKQMDGYVEYLSDKVYPPEEDEKLLPGAVTPTTQKIGDPAKVEKSPGKTEDGAMSDSGASATSPAVAKPGASFASPRGPVPPPPPPAPGTDPRSVSGTQQASQPTAGKRRTRRMKRLFR